MASVLNPYPSFADNAPQAMESYKEVFGGTLHVSTFGKFDATDSPGADKVNTRNSILTAARR